MLWMVLFWVLLVLSALGGFWYWRAQPMLLPGAGVVLILIALLGWKVYPPG